MILRPRPWSSRHNSAAARGLVCPRELWRPPRTLLLQRALSADGPDAYRRVLAQVAYGWSRWVACALTLTPAAAANAVPSLWILLVGRRARITAHDLTCSRPASWLTRLAARASGVPASGSTGGGRPA